jgi:flagellar basal body-associated protein FliL
MQCNRCGAVLPSGALSCPVCGNPTPYNQQEPGQYGSAATPSPYESTPPPGYGSPPASSANPYGPSTPGPYPDVPPTFYPPQPTPGPYPPQPTPGLYPPQPPPRKSNVGRVLLIIGIILLLIVVACVGAGFLIARNIGNSVTTSLNAAATADAAATATADAAALNQENATATADAATATAAAATVTAAQTPTGSGPSPSGSPISTSASAIITNLQMADQVSNTLPTHVTNTFKVNQRVYATFKVTRQSGYVMAKWYLNGAFGTSDKLQITAGDTSGYFSIVYFVPGQGAVELYYCTASDCSDAQLAQVASFTVVQS